MERSKASQRDISQVIHLAPRRIVVRVGVGKSNWKLSDASSARGPSSNQPPHQSTPSIPIPASKEVAAEASSSEAAASDPALLFGPAPKRLSKSLEALNCGAMWSSFVEEIVLDKGERGLGFSILDYQVIFG